MAITKIRLVISQPTTSSKPSEWGCSTDELGKTQKAISARAFHTMQVWKTEKPENYYHHQRPGEKQCAYCKAKVDCQKSAEVIGEMVYSDAHALKGTDPVANTGVPEVYMPIDPALLASRYLQIPLIRKWCDAIEKAAFARMKAGELTERHGLKAVSGGNGKRVWSDDAAVEEMFKSMKLRQDEMFTYKLISPAQAEKLLQDNPRKWTKAQKFIAQGQNGPSIVHISDPRPGISLVPSSAGFEVIEDEPAAPPAENPPPGNPVAVDTDVDDLI